jgi:flagellar basal body-associated protein FliL
MRDKNQKNNKRTKEQKTHVFEIHTMQSDNEQKANPTSQKAPPSGLPVTGVATGISASHKAEKPLPPKPKNKKQQPQTDNPFLTKKATPTETKKKKGSFAPGKKSEPVEKINYTPEDIAPHKKPSKKKSGNSQKKTMHIIMIIFIVLFLLGIVGFGIYMLKFNNQVKVDDIQVQDQNPVEIPVSDDIIIDTDEDITVQVEPTEQTYATNLPNYFSIDVESESSEADIANELTIIAQNMQCQDIVGPI